MGDFAWERLRRAPDVEAPNLQAYDATDMLLAAQAFTVAAAERLTGSEIVVIGDEYGAITLRLVHDGFTGIRVHQDLVTGRRALQRNAATFGLRGFAHAELDEGLLAGARLVLLQLPKALAELEEIADAVARWAAPDVTLIAGGRVKHMTLAMNDVLRGCFAHVQPQRAERKSRLIVAAEPKHVDAEPPFPVFADHALPSGRIRLAAHGGAFAGANLDIGTRALLDAFDRKVPQLLQNPADSAATTPDSAFAQDSAGVAAPLVIDLGCGTGALATATALAHPGVRVIATDRSAAAVRSARMTMRLNGIDDRVEVTHDDAGSEIPDASADLILLNPPFHLGTSVHTGAAIRLFEASARLLKPGGELWTVYNSHLAYRPQLTRIAGATEQVQRTAKFTVTRTIRTR